MRDQSARLSHWLRIATVALLAACSGETPNAPVPNAPAPPAEPRDAPSAATELVLPPSAFLLGRGGVDHIALGAYEFTVPADFNGGIFGTTTSIENRVIFLAVHFADGTVQGQYSYRQASDGTVSNFSGPVTCFQVYDTPVLVRFPDIPPQTSNRAKWGGIVESTDDPGIPVGTFIWFQSIDNSPPGLGSNDVSTLSGFGDEAANEAFCAADRVPNTNFGPHRIARGDIKVR